MWNMLVDMFVNRVWSNSCLADIFVFGSQGVNEKPQLEHTVNFNNKNSYVWVTSTQIEFLPNLSTSLLLEDSYSICTEIGCGSLAQDVDRPICG